MSVFIDATSALMIFIAITTTHRTLPQLIAYRKSPTYFLSTITGINQAQGNIYPNIAKGAFIEL